mmetsp:Transcript_1611/g.5052  ORF Transcript_1611/g.5052 Transcript_1611/m.5052 type:complete len:224 (-) Transcript_1611:26-697(-)
MGRAWRPRAPAAGTAPAPSAVPRRRVITRPSCGRACLLKPRVVGACLRARRLAWDRCPLEPRELCLPRHRRWTAGMPGVELGVPHQVHSLLPPRSRHPINRRQNVGTSLSNHVSSTPPAVVDARQDLLALLMVGVAMSCKSDLPNAVILPRNDLQQCRPSTWTLLREPRPAASPAAEQAHLPTMAPVARIPPVRAIDHRRRRTRAGYRLRLVLPVRRSLCDAE